MKAQQGCFFRETLMTETGNQYERNKTAALCYLVCAMRAPVTSEHSSGPSRSPLKSARFFGSSSPGLFNVGTKLARQQRTTSYPAAGLARSSADRAPFVPNEKRNTYKKYRRYTSVYISSYHYFTYKTNHPHPTVCCNNFFPLVWRHSGGKMSQRTDRRARGSYYPIHFYTDQHTITCTSLYAQRTRARHKKKYTKWWFWLSLSVRNARRPNKDLQAHTPKVPIFSTTIVPAHCHQNAAIRATRRLSPTPLTSHHVSPVSHATYPGENPPSCHPLVFAAGLLVPSLCLRTVSPRLPQWRNSPPRCLSPVSNHKNRAVLLLYPYLGTAAF